MVVPAVVHLAEVRNNMDYGAKKGSSGLKLKGTNKLRNTLGAKDLGRVSAKKGTKIILGTGNRGSSDLMS